MRVPQVLLFLLGFITAIHALALPNPFESISESTKELFKRKGGGGGGGKGGGSSSGGSSGTKGGSSSSESSSSGSSGSSLTSSSSSSGGRTSSGSGTVPRQYGTGSYYGGGASVPYQSGQRSPGGVAPYFLGGAALGFFPGLWLYGAYSYPLHPYAYHNDTTNQNDSLPVECLCSQYSECGCDNANDTDYINSVANNASVSHVADVNGTRTLVINGTLPNGTTAAGAAGSFRQGILEMSGWWIVVAGVAYTVWFM